MSRTVTSQVSSGKTPSLFDFEDYKAFVLAWIESQPGGGRGLRRQIAEQIGCQVAYVSHVLAGDRHFSPEQAEALTRCLAMRSEEAELFMLLVDRARAGTQPLKRMIDRQIRQRWEAFRMIKTRVKNHSEIAREDQATYYSSWHYQAVRVLLSVPGFGRAPEIARRLQLPVERVTEILRFFLEKGLAKEGKDGYSPTGVSMHLGADSPLVTKLHMNWRIHALRSLDVYRPDDLRYSSVVALSREDFEKVREIWLKALLDAHKVIAPSKEERLCAMMFDFYEI